MSARHRNSPPATPDQLRANAEAIREEIERLKSEILGHKAALPDLAGDPSEFARTHAALRDAQALLPFKEDALAATEAAIPAAEHRVKVDAVLAGQAAQRRKSDALARDLQTRHRKAAEALAAVLADIAADNHAWEVLNHSARELGLPMGASAERQARGDLGMRPHAGWYSLAEEIVVRDWSGRVLFGGTVGAYC
ncbi:MAG TPA: hypothetical protein VGD23_04490 [Sphingomicrobium sp.]